MMTRRWLGVALVWVWSMGLGGSPAQAQVAKQVIHLEPGWNAVRLRVDPLVPEVDRLLAGTPIQEVRFFEEIGNRPIPVDLDLAKPAGLGWLQFAPKAFSESHLLRALRGGYDYFVAIDPRGPAFDWAISGRPICVDPAWNPNAPNLVGIATDPAHPASFRAHFGASESLRDGPFYRLIPAGRWRIVNDPAAEAPRDGEAVVATCRVWTGYAGPVQIKTTGRDGLEWASGRGEESIRLINQTGRPQEIQLQLLPSQPSAESPEVDLGPPRILSWDNTPPGAWKPMDAGLILTLPPNGIHDLRLAVRRGVMERSMKPTKPGVSASHQGLIEIHSTEGTIWATLGVRVAVAPGWDGKADRRGLWVGWATVDRVSMPAAEDRRGIDEPQPTSRPFEMKLIIHVDAKGQVRLLPRAAEIRRLDGRVVVAASDSPAAIRRLSSASFAARGSFSLQTDGKKSFGEPGAILKTAVLLPYDDPRNPFVHRDHPDHDNRDNQYPDRKLPAGRESFDVRRDLKLTFSDIDPDNLPLSRSGEDRLGGDYAETILGIHKVPIHVKGIFRLQRISMIADFDAPDATPAK